MTLLDTSETLARIRAALPPGHRLALLAGELTELTELTGLAQLAAEASASETSAVKGASAAERLFPRKSRAFEWPGEIGALGEPEGSRGSTKATFLLWLGQRLKTEPSRPELSMEASPKPSPDFRQLVLFPPPGRYKIEYWAVSDGSLAGVEIATSAPLVLGPPGDGPLIVLVQRLA